MTDYNSFVRKNFILCIKLNFENLNFYNKIKNRYEVTKKGYANYFSQL